MENDAARKLSAEDGSNCPSDDDNDNSEDMSFDEETTSTKPIEQRVKIKLSYVVRSPKPRKESDSIIVQVAEKEAIFSFYKSPYFWADAIS